jgi:hypothetical protein
MYVTPTNRTYRTELARRGIAPRTILAAPTKAHIQRAARDWTTQLAPQRTSIRLNVCNSTHTVLKQYRFRPLAAGGAAPLPDHQSIFQGMADTLSELYHLRVDFVDLEILKEKKRVIIRYTINGTGPTAGTYYSMEQGLTDIVGNSTIQSELEAQLNQYACSGVDMQEAPQQLDKVATENTMRIRCAEHDVAILDKDRAVQHVATDPLDPVARAAQEDALA